MSKQCDCGFWLGDSVPECPECGKEFGKKKKPSKWEAQKAGVRSVLEALDKGSPLPQEGSHD